MDLEPSWLREQISFVPQDIVLFDGSIAFNIGLDTQSISRAEIEKAAELVGADRFIKKLPGTYDYPIREQGNNLSLGQRQLITFARALARQPQLVILDEATASVDATSERMIQSAIDRILKDRTVMVIAHRLSTIQHCDQIVVLESGEIKEIGTHDELLESAGAYFSLYQSIRET